MRSADNPQKTRTAVVRAAYAFALMVGATQGYLFGARLGGVPLGAIMAINGALFCALMVGAVAGWWTRRAPRTPASGTPQPPGPTSGTD